MENKLGILTNTYFSTENGKFKTLDYLDNMQGKNVKKQLNIDLSLNSKNLLLPVRITNIDIYNLFYSKTDLYFNLYEKDILLDNIINFFHNENFFNRDKIIFTPFTFLIKGKVFKQKDLNNILEEIDTNDDCIKFIDKMLSMILDGIIGEIQSIYGFENLEDLNLGIIEYNKYMDLKDKFLIYNRLKTFLNKDDKSQFIKMYLEEIIDKINVHGHNLSKLPININKVIKLAKEHNIELNMFNVETYKTLLNNVEKVKDVYIKFNQILIQNIINNAKNNKEYSLILSNNSTKFIVNNIFRQIINKYPNVFLEEKFNHIIFYKYTIESMIAIELNTDIINNKIIDGISKYIEKKIDEIFINEIKESVNLNDLYIFPIETEIALRYKMNINDFEKLVIKETKNNLSLDDYVFDLDILKIIWPTLSNIDVILEAKKILKQINLNSNLHEEIFLVPLENPKEPINFPLKIYRAPLEMLIVHFLNETKNLNIVVENIEKTYFNINIPKDISKLNDILIKYTNKIDIYNFENIVSKIRNEFLKTNKFKKEIIFEKKLNPELLQYIHSFSKMENSELIYLLNKILSDNIFEYDVFNKIITYKYPLEALLCIKLNIPINDELFGKLNVFPPIFVLEKAKENTSTLAQINVNIIKEINMFLSTFNKYPVTKFIKILDLKTVKVTENFRNNVRTILSKINTSKTEITYRPSEEEVIFKLLKYKHNLAQLIKSEILLVGIKSNLNDHIDKINRLYLQSGLNINNIEREVALEKQRKNYDSLLEEKIFESKNYILNATLVLFMCMDKNVLWFKAQSIETKYKILLDIIDNGLDKKYIPEYLNDYETFKNYLYNVFFKFICNTVIDEKIQKYNFNYKSPKAVFLNVRNLKDTTIEIVNDRPIVKKTLDQIIINKTIGTNDLSLDTNTNILRYNSVILDYNVDNLYTSENDFIYSKGEKYFYSELMYIMPNNMIINESSTKHMQYYIDGLSYFAKDIVPVYEFIFLNINHDIKKLNKEILIQYDYKIEEEKIIEDEKVIDQKIILDHLNNNDFSKINHLYIFENLEDDIKEFLKSCIILPDFEYINNLKRIFKDLIFYPETEFKNEILYKERLSNIHYIEGLFKENYGNINHFCKDLEYILYNFHNKDYMKNINDYFSYTFEDDKRIMKVKLEKLYTIEEIKLINDFNFLQDYGIYKIEFNPYELYKVGESSKRFNNLKQEYFTLCNLFIDTMDFEEPINSFEIFKSITSFLNKLNMPIHLSFENKIIFESNKIELENEIIKTVLVTEKRMDKFLNYIIQSLESRLTIDPCFFQIFYDSYKKYVNINHNLIVIDINDKVNVDVIYKLFSLSFFAPIKFVLNDIDDIDEYTITLEALYTNIKIYLKKDKTLNNEIFNSLNSKIVEINNYEEYENVDIKLKNQDKLLSKFVKKCTYKNIKPLLDEYYKVELKYESNIKILEEEIKIKLLELEKNIFDNITEFEEYKNILDLQKNYVTDIEFNDFIKTLNSDFKNKKNYFLNKNLNNIQTKQLVYLFKIIISRLNNEQVLEAERSRICRFILFYHNIKMIDTKEKSEIRNKFFNRLVKKFIFLNNVNDSKTKIQNIYFKDELLIISKSNINLLLKKENEIYLNGGHYETEMSNYIKKLTLKSLFNS